MGDSVVRLSIAILIVIGAFAPLWLVDWTRTAWQGAALEPVLSQVLTLSIDKDDLPPPAPVETARKIVVKTGDTLADILSRAKVPQQDASAAITALGKVYDANVLRPGQQVEVVFVSASSKDSFTSMTLHPSVSQEIVVRKDEEGGFAVENNEKSIELRYHAVSGAIDDSLYLSAMKAGVQPNVLMDVIKLMSYDVDFQRDIQPGDRFDVLYERLYTEDGKFVRTGAILYANLILSGKAHAFYRYAPKGEDPDYFSQDGSSIKKALLRTPVDGARISSLFGSRKNPVLGYTMMHRGVDFAVPTGTPIYAAGDGTIELRELNGAYGNYIRVRHNAEYETAYAHMSRFEPHLARGSRVKQGQIIGYVGSTGRATGPHLHYEVLIRGEQVNPVSIKMPTGVKLAGAELDRFKTARSRIDVTFDRLADPAAAIAANP